jgi:molybdopterin-binding protein
MELSARNQFKGKVTSITRGGVVAEITVDIGNGQEIVSVITNGSVDRLHLAVGSEVTAIVKATRKVPLRLLDSTPVGSYGAVRLR